MAKLALNQNQFAQGPILGQVSMLPNVNIVPARINPSSTVVITAGSPVKLIAGTSNEILIDGCADQTEGPVFGVVVYNMRKNTYAANDAVEVACAGSYVLLKSAGALARGTSVSSTAATVSADPLVNNDATSGHYLVGTVIDTATAANQLVRILIAPSKNA